MERIILDEKAYIKCKQSRRFILGLIKEKNVSKLASVCQTAYLQTSRTYCWLKNHKNKDFSGLTLWIILS